MPSPMPSTMQRTGRRARAEMMRGGGSGLAGFTPAVMILQSVTVPSGRTVLQNVTPVWFVSVRSASRRVVLISEAPARLALRRSAPVRSALPRLALARLAPRNETSRRSAPVRLVPDRSAPFRLLFDAAIDERSWLGHTARGRNVQSPYRSEISRPELPHPAARTPTASTAHAIRALR